MKRRHFLGSLYFVGFIILSNISLFSQKKDTLITIPTVDIISEKPIKDRIVQRIRVDTTVIQTEINNNLADLLSKHTPIFVKTYGQGSLATVSFRGTGASHTAVEWNGININNPMLGQVDFSQLPVIFIDQIEILPGSSSLQNNSGALGGLINISSQPKFDKKIYGMIGSSFGSFNTNQFNAQIGGGTKKWQTRIRIFQENSDNNFEYFNNANGLWNYEEQKNASYQKQGLLAETHYQTKKNLFSSSFWYHESDRNLPPIMSFQGMERIEKQKDKDIRVSFKWFTLFKKGNSELNTGFSTGYLNYYLAHQTPLGLFENQKSSTNNNSYFLKYKLEYQFLENLLLHWNSNIEQVDAHYFDDKKNQEFSPHRNAVGSSLTLFYSLKKTISAYILVRNEIIDNILTPALPAIGLEFSNFIIKGLNLKTNLSSNYHQPSLNDLYWIPGGNPNLKPEKSNSADLELSFSNDNKSLINYQLSTSLYASLVEDWILWQPSEYRYWTAQNMQEVFARGLETKAEIKSNFQKLNFILLANYAHTITERVEEDENNKKRLGNQLIYIPKNKANIFFSMLFYQYQLTYSYNYVGKRYTSTNETDALHYLDWYNLHDLGISKKWNFNYFSPQIELKIKNVLNTDYQAILWRAMPKRSYSFTLKINF